MAQSGDALAILLFLVGSAVSSLIGALSAPPGWRQRLLWSGVAVFVAATAWWLFKPNFGPWFAALWHSGALLMVFTVGIVCLTFPRGPYSAVYYSDPIAETDKPLSQWRPNMRVVDAVNYVINQSQFGKQLNPDADLRTHVTRMLIDAMGRGRVVVWGRNHPKSRRVQIRDGFWGGATEVNLNTDYAYSHSPGQAAYDIRVSREEIMAAWPPRATP